MTTLFFEGPAELSPGAQAVVLLKARLNEAVNAFEGRVTVSGSLEAVSADDTGSAIRLWPQRPTVGPDGVRFAGIIPGGIAPAFSNEITLLRVTVRAGDAGQAELSVADGVVLLNSSTGRSDALTIFPLRITVAEGAPEAPVPAESAVAPNVEAALVRNPSINDGAWSLVWDVHTPTGSRDELEMRERFLGFPSSWTMVSSPRRLEDQHRTSILELRAPEGAVMVRIVPWPVWLAWAAILTCVIIAWLVFRKSRR